MNSDEITDLTMPCTDGELTPAIGFSVHDEATANWLVRKIAECRAYSKRCEDWFEREKRRAKQDEESLLFRYGPQLMSFARTQIASAGGRPKSVNLPAGTLGFRAEPSKLVVDDEGVVISWAKHHNPAIVTIVERLSKSALNQHFEQTGELPEAGVHVEPARERFYVK